MKGEITLSVFDQRCGTPAGQSMNHATTGDGIDCRAGYAADSRGFGSAHPGCGRPWCRERV
jgi:hypothetical protein